MQATISSFGGIVPRSPDHALANYQAEIAHNCRLRRGTLEAWREPCKVQDAAVNAKTPYVYGCCYLSFPQVLEAAEIGPDWPELYVTGRTDHPERGVRRNGCCLDWYRLGVPAPASPPSASGTESCGRDSSARAYLYTYVNRWGEESAPSPASGMVTVEDGSAVSVMGIALPPEGYGIVGANVYRSATGARDADGKQQKQVTGWLFVRHVKFPSTSFTDSVRDSGLGLELDTEGDAPPPDGLRNLCAVEGLARLAGTEGNRVYLSANLQPWNWPRKYELTLDWDVVHMKCVDQRLYVTTGSVPYVVDVSGCDDTKCTPVMDAGFPLPDISCGRTGSAIATPFGMIYSSPLGAALLQPSAQWTILTKKWFTPEQWRKLKPETARFAYWQTFLFIVTDAASFVLNIDGDTLNDMHGAELTTISDSPFDMCTAPSGELVLLEDGELRLWDMGSERRPYLWRSRELTGPGHNPSAQEPNTTPSVGAMWSPASLRVRTKQTHVKIEAPTGTAYERTVSGERPVRLPRMGRHMWWKAELEGTEPVEYLDLGTSHFTVHSGA